VQALGTRPDLVMGQWVSFVVDRAGLVEKKGNAIMSDTMLLLIICLIMLDNVLKDIEGIKNGGGRSHRRK
jgi:hypothetical protein